MQVVGVATVKEQAFLTLASSWGEQVLSSIKTVIAYGGQNSELKRYPSMVATDQLRQKLLSIFQTLVPFTLGMVTS